MEGYVMRDSSKGTQKVKAGGIIRRQERHIYGHILQSEGVVKEAAGKRQRDEMTTNAEEC